MDNKTKLERIMADPILFIETFMIAVDKNGKKVPFILNPEQRTLLTGLEKRNVISKGRQLGISYVIQAYCLALCIVNSDTSCMIIAHTDKATRNVFNKLKQLYRDMADCVKLQTLTSNRQEISFVNGSSIVCSTMSSADLGRSNTINGVCHLSEVAFMKPDCLEKNIVALEQAVSSKGIMILESTSNSYNLFSDIYLGAEKGENLYKAWFFPYYKDKIMFRDEVEEYNALYKKMYSKELKLDDLSEQELIYYNIGVDLERLTWRRLKIRNTVGGEKKFMAEFPATAQESFVSTDDSSIFDMIKVQKQMLERREIERLTNIIDIPTELKPYLKTFLSIYERPERGQKYYIGVDVGQGIKKDATVFEVFNKDGKECAQFKTNTLQPHICANILNALGIYYNRGLLIIEKASSGFSILDLMITTHKYTNIYRQKTFDDRGKTVKKRGFVTSSKTKPIIINRFSEWFDNDEIFICSQNVLEEMKTYIFDGKSTNASSSYHDDTIIACSLACEGIVNGRFYL